MIEIVGARKAFGRRTLWDGLTETIPAGAMVALVGASGSGKSTLLNCIGLLERLDAGRIIVQGTDVTRLRAGGRRRFRRDRLGYLFQNYALVEDASVRANLDLAVPTWRLFRPKAVRAAQVKALAEVGLAGRERARVHTLSGGEQQRVALARLIMKNPTVVLADEPTGALDETNAAMVVEHLRGLADAGACVVVATHNADVASACDRVIDLGSVATVDQLSTVPTG